MGKGRLPAGWMLVGATAPPPAAIIKRLPAASTTVPGRAPISPLIHT